MAITKRVAYFLCMFLCFYGIYAKFEPFMAFAISIPIAAFYVLCYATCLLTNYENKEIFIIDANGVIQEIKQVVV